jgi:hypothetical protein
MQYRRGRGVKLFQLYDSSARDTRYQARDTSEAEGASTEEEEDEDDPVPTESGEGHRWRV